MEAVEQEWDASGKPIQAPAPSPAQHTEWDAQGKPISAAPANAAPEGFFHSLAAQFGLTPESAQASVDDMAAHPIRNILNSAGGPVGQILEGLYKQGKISVADAANVVKDLHAGNKSQAAVDAVHAIPIMGPAMVKAANQANETATGNGGYLDNLKSVVTSPGAMGTLVGASAQAAPIAAGAIEAAPAGDAALARVAKPVEAAVDVAKRVPGAVAQGAQAAKQAAYPSNVSIPADAINAQNFIKALTPDAAAVPNVKSAVAELPDVLAAAKKNGTVLNGKLDTAQAIRDRGAQIQSVYSDDILKPNADVVTDVPNNYNGETSGGKYRATLDQVNDRVDAINSELKSNFRKKLASQTTEANASDADLIAEKQGLTTILHNKLADLTNLQPEDIASLRQRAGKLRSLAQEIEVSADKDTLSAGTREKSGGPTSFRNPLEPILDKLGGGQEVIGNRIFKNALDQFTPQENPLPQPQAKAPVAPAVRTPITGSSVQVPTFDATPQTSVTADNVAARVAARQAATEANQAAARQEALHAQSLDQAAQDASTQRAAAASTVRQAGLTGPKLWASQGYSKVLTHLAGDKTSGLSPTALDAVSKTPGGTQLLIKASDLQPGSAAMKNIVQKMNDLLGASK